MSDRTQQNYEIAQIIAAGLQARNRRTSFLHGLVVGCVALALGSLVLITTLIAFKGIDSLTTYHMQLPLTSKQGEKIINAATPRKQLSNCRTQLRKSLYESVGVKLSRSEKKAARSLLSFSEGCESLGESYANFDNNGAFYYSALTSASASYFLHQEQWIYGDKFPAKAIKLNYQSDDDTDYPIELSLNDNNQDSLKNLFAEAKNRSVGYGSAGSLLLISDYGALAVKQPEENRFFARVLYGNEKSINKASFWHGYALEISESERNLSDLQVALLLKLNSDDRLTSSFDVNFFLNSASRYPERAGIYSALIGSIFTLFITFIFAFPIGVGAGIYLEELSVKNRMVSFLEVSINNMAAVPSIVFGLLGLAVLINFIGMPRSAPVVGGVVLGLMVMPTIIVATRAALQSVPRGIRDAALALGASRIQAVFHHVLPSAIPGIMTGSIIAMARALGETAPLLMVGMVAFIASAPTSLTEPATVLPVQIYLWAASPEQAFAARSSAAIIVLLLFLLAMNLIAVIIRNRYQIKR